MSPDITDPHLDIDDALQPLGAARHWYLGLSGGVDSTVLLHLLQDFRSRHESAPPLTAIHVDHGMQPGSSQWQQYCEQACSALEVPLVSRALQVSGGEAAARRARYAVFEELVGEGEVLFLAHHLDDQVETFFLRLLRGAGVDGLAAMPAVRSLGDGKLSRPMLEIPRSHIEACAAARDIDFIEDPSNRDTAMDRNFLRAQVLPLLETRWPAYRRTVSRASAHMAVTASALRDGLTLPDTCYSTASDPGLPLAPLLECPADRAARMLRVWFNLVATQPPDQSSLEEFLRQLREAGEGSAPRLDSGSYTLQRYRDAVFLLPAFAAPPPAQPRPLAPGQWLDIPGVGRVGLVQSEQGLYLPPGAQPELRWRRGGERLRLPGRNGSPSLKALLQASGLPPWWRERVPLLYLHGELVAVADLAAGGRAEEDDAAVGEDRWQLSWSPEQGGF